MHKSKKLILFLLPIAMFFYSSSESEALVKIDITQGQIDPMPIAITEFQGDQDIGKKIFTTIANDLEGSGLFKLIDKKAFLEQTSFIKQPNFSNWRKINSTVLVVGQIENTSGDEIKVSVKIWDPYGQTLVEGMSYKVKRSGWSRAAHKIADKIYTNLTGEQGYFDSRVVFIMESGSGKRKVKKLAIMDQDGGNVQILSDGRRMALTPRFDPSSHRIAYISYSNNIPQVFLFDLATGSRKLVGNFKGMSFAPRFSPDGNYLIMSIARNGTTSIYEVNLRSSTMKMITGVPGTISTSPTYSPDGRHIVFNSDRDGPRALYVMNRDGSGIRRISFGKGNYADPVWSPRGDFIAFTKFERGNFYIGVMRPDGSGERMLTTSWLDEGPTWSPNGRVIMFSREYRNGQNYIHKVDITGYNERRVKTPGTASDPAWSRLLQ
jgi:TolB protein